MFLRTWERACLAWVGHFLAATDTGYICLCVQELFYNVFQVEKSWYITNRGIQRLFQTAGNLLAETLILSSSYFVQ